MLLLASEPGLSLIFISLDVDYVTALCSQVVYEGLVDDTFRVKCGEFLPSFEPLALASDLPVSEGWIGGVQRLISSRIITGPW